MKLRKIILKKNKMCVNNLENIKVTENKLQTYQKITISLIKDLKHIL